MLFLVSCANWILCLTHVRSGKDFTPHPETGNMHRLRSKSAIHRFRLAAVLLCTKCLATPLTAGFLVYSIICGDRQLTLYALGAMGLTMLVMVSECLVAARTHCPLCITPVLARKGCTKNRHARKLLGSHRLHVAFSILFRNSFRCPYCHEPTALELRRKHHPPRYSRG